MLFNGLHSILTARRGKAASRRTLERREVALVAAHRPKHHFRRPAHGLAAVWIGGEAFGTGFFFLAVKSPDKALPSAA